MTKAENPISSSKELIAKAIEIAKKDKPPTVAVAAAQDSAVLQAITEAEDDNFLKGLLIGDESKIREIASVENIDLTDKTIINEPDPLKAAHLVAQSVHEGKAQAVMKGFLPTSALLKVILDKKYKLRGENTLSHCAVLEIEGYHKLINMTDGGMVVKPSVEQKFQILENAVLVGRALGISPVRVAISAATDHITEQIPHTLSDTDNLIPMMRNRIKDILVQGPLTFGLATSKEVARKSRKVGEVIGDADIFLVDSIEEGNIVSKSMIQFGNTVFAGVIVGAKVPVSLVSRTDTIVNKKASLALACVVAHYYKQNKVWEK